MLGGLGVFDWMLEISGVADKEDCGLDVWFIDAGR
jgi:hypothetical protein